MGGFLPTAAMSILQMGFDAVQRSRQAEASRAAQEAQARAETERIRRVQQIQERQRNRALTEALATQRARFGAKGIGAGGSAEAVLSGLATEAELQSKEARSLAQSRVAGINDRLGYANRRNLLEASQPTYRSAFGLIQRGLRRVPLLEP